MCSGHRVTGMTELSYAMESSFVLHGSSLLSQEKPGIAEGVIQGGSIENSIV